DKPITINGARITNDEVTIDANHVLYPDPSYTELVGCEAASKLDLVSIASPFRVLYYTVENDQLTSERRDYILRICIWKS
ncbi:MAG: hypothetical protein ABH803_02550, partial [Candidatus Micrarchaeota archaeon]